MTAVNKLAIAQSVRFGSLVLFFVAVVGWEYWSVAPLGFAGIFRDALRSVLRYNSARWVLDFLVIFAWLGILLLQWRRLRAKSESPSLSLPHFLLSSGNIWMLLFLGQFITCYAIHFQVIQGNTDLLVVLWGILVGQSLLLWRASLQPEKEEELGTRVLLALAAVLTVASVFQPDWSQLNQLFYYREKVRWSGPCKNPNHFGLLMAVGIILVVGFLLATRCSQQRSKLTNNWARLGPMAGVVALCLLSLGLLRSYSRGAWLSTIVGTTALLGCYFFRKWQDHSQARMSGKEVFRITLQRLKPVLKVALIGTALFVIAFWIFRQTEAPLARRLFSIGNVNDLSWRNRVDAYVGAAQMIADHPLTGVGWGEPELKYNEYYRKSRLTDGLAIILNCYLMLGMVLGVPGLICFLAYLGWKLLPGKTKTAFSDIRSRHPWNLVICRCAVLALLIGCWFDRGLFIFPVASCFWLLLAGGDDSPKPVTGEQSETISIGRVLRVWAPACVLVVLGIALWAARNEDSFQRKPLHFPTSSGQSVKGIAVLPQPTARHPVLLYLYDSGESLQSSGHVLRRMAELGYAAVAIDYDQDSSELFTEQLVALRGFLEEQSWAASNATGWVTVGNGTTYLLRAVRSRHDILPQVIACLGGSGIAIEENFSPVSNACPVLVVREETDKRFPPQAAEKLAALFRHRGHPVEVANVPSMEDSSILRPVTIRLALEFCMSQLPRPDYSALLPQDFVSPENIREINRAMQNAGQNRPELWKSIANAAGSNSGELAERLAVASDYALTHNTVLPEKRNVKMIWPMLGAGILLTTVLCRRRGRVMSGQAVSSFWLCSPFADKLLSRIALVSILLATALTVLNIQVARQPVTPFNLKLASLCLIRPEWKEDLQFVTQKLEDRTLPLMTILEHVELAHLQQKQFYNETDPALFRDAILSPTTSSDRASAGWRRILWENFHPRVRKERDPMVAASIVFIHLRERVGIKPDGQNSDPETSWIQQTATLTSFKDLYIAALRSVGIAARLDDQSEVELWTGAQWKKAPLPLLSTSLIQ